MRIIGVTLITALLTILSGCAALIDSVNEEPINIDSTKRTWGAWGRRTKL